MATSDPASDPRWSAAWRIEEDPSLRLRRLRRFRMGTATGCVVAGVAVLVLLIGPRPVTAEVPSLLVYLFVGYLFTLAPASWFALSWAIRRTPDRVAFDDGGLLIRQVGGQVTAIPWSTPDFALDLTNWGANDFTSGVVVLTSRMKSPWPEVPVTIEGTGALRSEALGRGLCVAEKVEGRPPKTFGLLELRSPTSPPLSGVPEGREVQASR